MYDCMDKWIDETIKYTEKNAKKEIPLERTRHVQTRLIKLVTLRQIYYSNKLLFTYLNGQKETTVIGTLRLSNEKRKSEYYFGT